MHETIDSKVTTIVFFLLQGKESQPNIQRTSLSTRQILYAKGRGLRWFGSDCISGQGVSRYARGDVRAYSRVVHACGGCFCAGRVAPSSAYLSEQRSVRLRGAEPATFPKRRILTPY
jgi:hypothetical protein